MRMTKLRVALNGKVYKYPTAIETRGNRLYFPDAEFALKDEIAALQGSQWHGRDDEPEKIWSALDSDRNRFQLDYMEGLNPYKWWDRPLEEVVYDRKLRNHQKAMANHILTYHYGILAAEMGLGKTLAAIEVIERSGETDWWWIGPKSAVAAVEREFKKWGLMVPVKLMTYEGFTKLMKNWKPGDPAPRGVVFDESSRLKNCTTKRSCAAQALANAMRGAR